MDPLRLLDGRLKLRHLVLIDTLTRCGSVIGAAAALHVTQPVATRTLRELEAILGVCLFDRGPRGVVPTVFGETFARHARVILDQLAQAGRQVTELVDAGHECVVVGVDPAEADIVVLRAISQLKNQYPQLTVVIRAGVAEELSVELNAGNIDLIVGRFGSSATEAEVRTPLYDASIEIFARAEHPLAQRRAAALADLADYPWAVPGPLRCEVDRFFAQRALSAPKNRIEVASSEFIRQLLLETDFVGLLPSAVGRAEPRLRLMPVHFAATGGVVGITTAATRALRPGAQALMQALQEAAANHSDQRVGDDPRSSAYSPMVTDCAS